LRLRSSLDINEKSIAHIQWQNWTGSRRISDPPPHIRGPERPGWYQRDLRRLNHWFQQSSASGSISGDLKCLKVDFGLASPYTVIFKLLFLKGR